MFWFGMWFGVQGSFRFCASFSSGSALGFVKDLPFTVYVVGLRIQVFGL